MEAPTHLLIGIIIQKAVLKHSQFRGAFGISIIIISAFFSHFIIDCFSRFTYHPPKADWNDPFWVSYHLMIYSLTLIIIILFGREYWIGIIFSILVDIIDWGIIRGLLKKEGIIHPLIDKISNFFFGENKYMYQKWTIIFE